MESVSDAKRELMNLCYCYVIPPMVDVYMNMWNEAKSIGKGQPLKAFQTLLLEVKHHWSDVLISQHTETITNSCNFFHNLVRGIFASHIKTINSIRTADEEKQMSFDVPSNDKVVYSIYTEMAGNLYRQPRGMMGTADEITVFLEKIGKNAVDNGIRNLIPWSEVLHINVGRDVLEIPKEEVRSVPDLEETTEEPTEPTAEQKPEETKDESENLFEDAGEGNVFNGGDEESDDEEKVIGGEKEE